MGRFVFPAGDAKRLRSIGHGDELVFEYSSFRIEDGVLYRDNRFCTGKLTFESHKEKGEREIKIWLSLAWGSVLHMMMSSVSRAAAVTPHLLILSCDNVTDPCLGGMGEES